MLLTAIRLISREPSSSGTSASRISPPRRSSSAGSGAGGCDGGSKLRADEPQRNWKNQHTSSILELEATRAHEYLKRGPELVTRNFGVPFLDQPLERSTDWVFALYMAYDVDEFVRI